MQKPSKKDIAVEDGGDLHGSVRATRARARGTLDEVLGFSLIAERRRRGWTQTQLADALGASRDSVHRWETSKTLPRAHYVVALVRWHARRREAA